MKNWIAFTLLLVSIMFLIIIFYKPGYLSTDSQISNCHVIEYATAPDDSQTPLNDDEIYVHEPTIEHLRGRRGRRGRHGGGKMFWPWRSWPRHLYRRPWRSYVWQSYPYLYTYPATYYTNTFVQPTQRFKVRIGPKTKDHPSYDQGGRLGYMISTGNYTGCGNSGAYLELTRGRTYEFDIYTASDCVNGQALSADELQPFFFTTNKSGGSQSGELFDKGPVVNGTLRITITNNLPNEFYYQSTNDKDVGGLVKIVS